MIPGPFGRSYEIAAQHAARLVDSRPVSRGLLAAKKDSRGQLYIYDQIGPSFFGDGGITDKSVQAELNKLVGVSSLDIFINSEGGLVYQGDTIYNLLKRFSAKKTVYVDGIAASAASFIAMVGDEIVMAENATMMIHKAQGFTVGSDDDHEETKKILQKANLSIAGMYAARTGHPAEKILGWMADELWMTAQEAVGLKFADRIEPNAAPVKASIADAETPPLVRIAAETHRRNAIARFRQIDVEHSVLQDRRRASPESGAARGQPRGPGANETTPLHTESRR